MIGQISIAKPKLEQEQGSRIEELLDQALNLSTVEYVAYWRSLPDEIKTPELVFHHLMNCVNLHEWQVIDFREIGEYLEETRQNHGYGSDDLEYWQKIHAAYWQLLQPSTKDKERVERALRSCHRLLIPAALLGIAWIFH